MEFTPIGFTTCSLKGATLGNNDVTYHKFSDLDKKSQEAALEIIANLNRSVSTTGGKTTWEKYTSTIKERLDNCSNAKNTLFLAKSCETFVGYIAFYTRVDKINSVNQVLKSDQEAYCFLTAVDEKFRGKGIAEGLKIQIFEPEHGVTKFRGKMKANNNASIRLLDKLSEKGYPAKKKITPPDHYLYSVKSKQY